MLRERFIAYDAKAFFLDAECLHELEAYLKQNGWLAQDGQVLSAKSAGAGNMNCVLRVKTTGGSIIVKQSRPWVEKFPAIAAPVERVVVEGQFYQLVQLNDELKQYMPQLLGFDERSSVLILEDLGDAADYTSIYEKGNDLTNAELDELTHIMSLLHEAYNMHTTRERIFNRAMRQLNHEHLFVYPFEEDNGLDLNLFCPGLQEASLHYKRDEFFKEKIRQLGQLYLADGTYLLHGDYYPGSWLNTEDGIKLIDPEFCFFGPFEFELGVFMAHLYLSHQPGSFVQRVLDEYEGYERPNAELLAHFTGIEIMRRLIGIAQLPLEMNLEERRTMLQLGYQLIMDTHQTLIYQSAQK